MPKQTTRQQMTDVAIFIVARSPKWITSNLVMAFMDCSHTKALNLMKSLSDTSKDFSYQNGDIKFTGDKNAWVAASLWEDF